MSTTTKNGKAKPAVFAEDPPELSGLLADCNEECAASLRELWRLDKTIKRSTLLVMWQQGEIIERLRQEAYSRPAEGIDPVNPVAIAASILERDERYVNKVGQLYRAFPSEGAREMLLSLRMRRSGKPLTWAHMEQLLKRFADEGRNDEFQRLIKKALDNDWSALDIEQYLKNQRTESGAETSRGGGRPTAVPPRFDGRINRLLSHLSVVNKNAQEIYRNPSYDFVASISEMSQREVADNAGQIETAIGRLRTEFESMRQLLDDLETRQLPAVLDIVHKCSESVSGKKPETKTHEAGKA